MYCASRVFVEVTWCFVVSLSVCTSQGHVSVRVRWYSTHQAHWKEYREFCMSNWRAYTVGAHKPILAASSTTMFVQSHSESNHIKHYSFKVRWLFCQVLPIFSVKSRSILLLAIWIPIYRFYSSSFWGWAAESFGWVRNGKRPESQVGPRVVHLSSIWGFLKWGILKTMGFNTKMLWWLDDLGCPHPRKPPYDSSIAFQHYPDVKHFAYDSMLCFFPGSRCIEEMNIWSFRETSVVKLVLLPSKSIAQDVTLTYWPTAITCKHPTE